MALGWRYVECQLGGGGYAIEMISMQERARRSVCLSVCLSCSLASLCVPVPADLYRLIIPGKLSVSLSLYLYLSTNLFPPS